MLSCLSSIVHQFSECGLMLLHVKHLFLVVIVLSLLLLLNSNILKLTTFALAYCTHSGADDVHPPFICDYQCWRSNKTAPLVSSIYLILTYCQNFYMCVDLLASPEMLSMTINATKGGPDRSKAGYRSLSIL